MAENRLPRALNKLFAHADLQAGACRQWQDSLGLRHIRSEHLEPIIATARAAEAELRAAHVEWSEARSERRQIDHESWDFIALTRRCLAVPLGERWSVRWAVVGFIKPTLRVPEQFAARAHILDFLTTALEQNPDWEVPAANFTTTRAQAAHGALTGADARFRSSRTRLHTARKARNVAVDELNSILRRFKKQLSAVLKPENPLWLAFDLNQPIRQRRKRAAKTNVVPANDSPQPGTAGVSPASSFVDIRRQDAGAPGAAPDSDECEAPAAFSRMRPEFSAESIRMSEMIHARGDDSWWSRLREGAWKIRWNLF